MKNNQKILLLSGPIAVGKSTIATLLESEHGYLRVRTSQLLEEKLRIANLPVTRRNLQSLGDELDKNTDFNWVVDDVLIPATMKYLQQRKWLFDSVRKPEQVSKFKSNFNFQVYQIYINASESILKHRYMARQIKNQNDNIPYEEAVSHSNEIISRSLLNIADFVINVDDLSPEVVVRKIISRLC